MLKSRRDFQTSMRHESLQRFSFQHFGYILSHIYIELQISSSSEILWRYCSVKFPQAETILSSCSAKFLLLSTCNTYLQYKIFFLFTSVFILQPLPQLILHAIRLAKWEKIYSDTWRKNNLNSNNNSWIDCN